MPIRVAIVEDDEPFREGLKTILAQSDEFVCVAACGSTEEALECLPPAAPDVALVDIALPGLSGVECVRELNILLPGTEFMMLTVFEDYDRIYQALAAGASGYLAKRTSSAELLEAVRDLHNGGSPMSSAIARKVVQAFRQLPPSRPEILSLREQEVLSGLARGHLYKQIGEELGISFHTVRSHVQKIYEKLHVHSRAEAVAQMTAGFKVR